MRRIQYHIPFESILAGVGLLALVCFKNPQIKSKKRLLEKQGFWGLDAFLGTRDLKCVFARVFRIFVCFFFLSQKRQTARHCKNLQIMVTTSYLDIIKSREKERPNSVEFGPQGGEKEFAVNM